ncbi:MAG: DUF58 domain-containing protein [Acidobacteriota bacterium]|nr:MAG: DUF58 domain-containing protein [Acidobacteriota bacterium]
MFASRRISAGLKDFLWAAFFLTLALFAAISSSVARRNGLLLAAVILSLIALSLAAVVTLTAVPKLMRRARTDLWSGFRFFRVTRRGLFFVLLVFLIGLSTFNTGNNLLILVLSFLLAALLVSGMASNLVLSGLRVRLTIPEAIHAGQKTALVVHLRNLKRGIPSFGLKLRGRKSAEIDQAGTTFFAQEASFPYLPPKGSGKTRLECEFLFRGVYPVEGFEVRTQFPFGFVVRGREVMAEGQITVYPALIDLNNLLLRFPFLQGPELQNRRGSGSGLYNIRDYQRGDDARFVHWKSSAKLSRLMIKEFVEERDDFMQLVLSTCLKDPTPDAMQSFEKALSVITSLSVLYRKRGQSFSFYSGEFSVQVDSRRETFDALMGYLAVVQPSSESLLDPKMIREGSVLFCAGESGMVRGVPSINYLDL